MKTTSNEFIYISDKEIVVLLINNKKAFKNLDTEKYKIFLKVYNHYKIMLIKRKFTKTQFLSHIKLIRQNFEKIAPFDLYSDMGEFEGYSIYKSIIRLKLYSQMENKGIIWFIITIILKLLGLLLTLPFGIVAIFSLPFIILSGDYSTIPQIIDMVLGIVFNIGFFYLFIKNKKPAISLHLFGLAFPIILSFINLLFTYNIITSIFVSGLAFIIWFIPNYNYFTSRSELFKYPTKLFDNDFTDEIIMY